MKPLPLYVALDVEDEQRALWIAREVADQVEGFKVGPRLFFKAHPSLILKLKTFGKILLDFKFFDIPSSMVGAVQTAFDLGVDSITVHASAGMVALSQLAELEQRLKARREFRILAVTVLTSFSQRTMPYFTRHYAISSQVEMLSDLVIKSGLSALVCSGQELCALRKRYPSAYLLTPGVRMSQQASEDQNRVCTPKEVLQAGANAFVMGRPIYTADDPAAVCRRIQKMCC